MSYIRIKTIKGRQYAYRQTSVRQGKKVRTISEYLGCISGGLLGSSGISEEEKKRREYQKHYNRAMRSLARDEAKFSEWQKKTYGETGEERAEREAKQARFSQENFLRETSESAAAEPSDALKSGIKTEG